MSDNLFSVQKDVFSSSAALHTSTGNGKTLSGLNWPRLFSQGNPYEQIEWDIRDARIAKHTGPTPDDL